MVGTATAVECAPLSGRRSEHGSPRGRVFDAADAAIRAAAAETRRGSRGRKPGREGTTEKGSLRPLAGSPGARLLGN